MNANIAGIYGAQIFRQDDRPLYRRGFSVAIAVLAVGLSLVIARWVDDLLRRRKKTEQFEVSDSEIGSNAEAVVKAVPPTDPKPVVV